MVVRLRRDDYNWSTAVTVLVISLSVAVLVTVADHWNRPLVGAMLRDPVAVARSSDDVVHLTTGWLSYVGVLALAAASAISLHVSRLLAVLGDRRGGRFFLFGGIISAILCIDDLFMLHDGVLADRGIPEKWVLLVWGLTAVAWGVTYLQELLHDRDMPILALAVSFFVLSAISEALAIGVLHEEATKLVATLCWAMWFWRATARRLTDRRQAAPVSARL